MKTTTQIAAITLATLTLAAAGAVFAHPGMGYGMGYGMGPGRPRAMGYAWVRERVPAWGWDPACGPAGRRRRRSALAQLKAELKITAAAGRRLERLCRGRSAAGRAAAGPAPQMQALMQDPRPPPALGTATPTVRKC